jgi:hypothetical protein
VSAFDVVDVPDLDERLSSFAHDAAHFQQLSTPLELWPIIDLGGDTFVCG